MGVFHMKRIISSLLIIGGILFISMPFIKNQLIKENVDKNMKLVEEISYEEIEINESREAIFDYSSVRDVSFTTILNNRSKVDYDYLVGYITIDQLNIDLPILKGVTDANLLVGASTMKEDQLMGKGNYTLASHYISDKKTLFGPLLDIEIGTIVKISNKSTVYEYEIFDTRIVPDTAMYMLEDSRADKRRKPIISLMTCYYTSRNGQRFFALGELVDEYPHESLMIELE